MKKAKKRRKKKEEERNSNNKNNHSLYYYLDEVENFSPTAFYILSHLFPYILAHDPSIFAKD